MLQLAKQAGGYRLSSKQKQPRTAWQPKQKRINARPFDQDFTIIQTNIPSIYTSSMFDPVMSLEKWSLESSKIFSLGSKFIPPSAFDYKLPGNGTPEFAFIGRSNVGKSSLVNALLGGGSKLAKMSKEPGCTKSVNFFAFVRDADFKSPNLTVGHQAYLVDLPGYGYARSSQTDRESWQTNIDSYVQLRDNSILRRTFLLIDSRREIMTSDIKMMIRLDAAANPYQVVKSE